MKKKKKPAAKAWRSKRPNEKNRENLRERVTELEETLRAIRSGEVDAVVVSAPQGDQVFTLQGAEHLIVCWSKPSMKAPLRCPTTAPFSIPIAVLQTFSMRSLSDSSARRSRTTFPASSLRPYGH